MLNRRLRFSRSLSLSLSPSPYASPSPYTSLNYRRSDYLSLSSSFSSAASLQEEEDVEQKPIPSYPPHTPIHYPQFSFQITPSAHSSLSSVSPSKARLGRISTPHGDLETPNFIFCATKAAMKSITMQQMRDENTQVVLANTYHLMLTPGADLVEKMGGLHKMTGWHGPMLTDSGGYQIFSMGHGSVSNEIKGRRGAGNKVSAKDSTEGDSITKDLPEELEPTKSLLGINEEGAVFRSFIDGMIHHLTPEKSIQIQRKLGADLIVVFDECTPFNVAKTYTQESMHRSHRWAIRCLDEFERSANTSSSSVKAPQALYGIVQGGVYKDLREQSTDFVNNQPFFGIAIGGSLGATKQDMHKIVEFTRGRLRDDRPIHLLGIGGIRDIFHGVRQGIDTFDCVHPTRLGRHGGALVKAKHWSDNINTSSIPESISRAFEIKSQKIMKNEENRILSLTQILTELNKMEDIEGDRRDHIQNKISDIEKQLSKSKKRIQEISHGDLSSVQIKGYSTHKNPLKGPTKVREHMNVMKSSFRDDHRPIDSSCTCYTCRTYSRAYLHHLFKAKESLGGILVTIHNVHFMNKMMSDIRKGIMTDTLDDVENEYIHSDLKESLATSSGLSLGE